MERLANIEKELSLLYKLCKETNNQHLKINCEHIHNALKSIQEIILCVENKKECIDQHEKIILSHTTAINELQSLENVIDKFYKE